MTNATPAAAPQPPLSESEDRQWASFAHLGGILGPIPSLIIYLVFKDRGAFTRTEAKEALNFQITLTIVGVAFFVVSSIINVVTFFVLSPLLSLISFAIWVVGIIFSILGFLKAKDGVSYRYPFAIRLIK